MWHVQPLGVFRPATDCCRYLSVDFIKFGRRHPGLGGHVGERLPTGRRAKGAREKSPQFAIARVARCQVIRR